MNEEDQAIDDRLARFSNKLTAHAEASQKASDESWWVSDALMLAARLADAARTWLGDEPDDEPDS